MDSATKYFISKSISTLELDFYQHARNNLIEIDFLKLYYMRLICSIKKDYPLYSKNNRGFIELTLTRIHDYQSMVPDRLGGLSGTSLTLNTSASKSCSN